MRINAEFMPRVDGVTDFKLVRDDFYVDPEREIVVYNGKLIRDLTTCEIMILMAIAEADAHNISYEEIKKRFAILRGDRNFDEAGRTFDIKELKVHISNIRAKHEDIGIVNVRNFGYRLE